MASKRLSCHNTRLATRLHKHVVYASRWPPVTNTEPLLGFVRCTPNRLSSNSSSDSAPSGHVTVNCCATSLPQHRWAHSPLGRSESSHRTLKTPLRGLRRSQCHDQRRLRSTNSFGPVATSKISIQDATVNFLSFVPIMARTGPSYWAIFSLPS